MMCSVELYWFWLIMCSSLTVVVVLLYCVSCDIACSIIPNWQFKRNFRMQRSFGVLMSGERRIAFLLITAIGVSMLSVSS